MMARLYKRSSAKKTDQSSPSTLVFIRNGEHVECENIDPFETVLDYLRGTAGLCGARRGCTQGHCGACTVVVGELRGSGVDYHPVNSCMTFMASLHGKHLVTVEGITKNGKPHPVQQALVSSHAIQCGYCTSGVVMSLYSLCQEPAMAKSRDHINDALSGNLCRCTGYRPITSAAQKVLKRKNLDKFGFDDREISRSLKKIRSHTTTIFSKAGRHYHAPVKSDDLAMLVQEYPRATLSAGATEAALWQGQQNRLISLDRIDALKHIRVGKDMITLGAGVTLTEARQALGAEYSDMEEVIRRFASPQIRCRATLAGNLASSAALSDFPPALIALDAGLTLRVGSFRRHLQLEDFYQKSGKANLKSGEFIESIQIPRTRQNSFFHAWKLSRRYDLDRSLLSVAILVVLDVDNRVIKTRICYGGTGPAPIRATKLERALTDSPWTLQTILRGMPCLDEDLHHSSNPDYDQTFRLLAAKNVLKRFFLETQSGSIQTRVCGESSGR